MGQALGLYGILFLVILGILWLFVPFAIFGIKPLLIQMLKELKELNKKQTVTNEHLKALVNTQNEATHKLSLLGRMIESKQDLESGK